MKQIQHNNGKQPKPYVKSQKQLTRHINDDCAYKHRLYESTSPLMYQINPIAYESCSKCHMAYPGFLGTLGGHGFGIGPDRVDVDSDLRQQTRILTRCPTHRYNPYSYSYCYQCQNCNSGLPCGCAHCKTKDVSNLKDCRPGIIPIESQDTRQWNACSQLNGLFINRFEHLCQNPQVQGRWQFYPNNRRLGEETRLDMRDSYPIDASGKHVDCHNMSLDNMDACRDAGGSACRHLNDFRKNIYI
jgi:hypothetical protein